VIGDWWLVVGQWPKLVGDWWLVVWSMVGDGKWWSLVAGRWSLVVCGWLLMVGGWILLVSGRRSAVIIGHCWSLLVVGRWVFGTCVVSNFGIWK